MGFHKPLISPCYFWRGYVRGGGTLTSHNVCSYTVGYVFTWWTCACHSHSLESISPKSRKSRTSFRAEVLLFFRCLRQSSPRQLVAGKMNVDELFQTEDREGANVQVLHHPLIHEVSKSGFRQIEEYLALSFCVPALCHLPFTESFSPCFLGWHYLPRLDSDGEIWVATKLDAGYPESLRQRQVDAIISQNVLNLSWALLQ